MSVWLRRAGAARAPYAGAVTWPRVDGMRSLELGSPGEMRARLNGLVLEGRKRATAGLVAEYEQEGEELEHVGERLVLLDDDGAAVATVEVTGVEVTTFGEVPWEFAQAEGEGHRDLDHWREGHRRFWAGEGAEVVDDTPVVLIRLALVSRTLRVPVDGGELVGEVRGEGPPVLLLHGGPGLSDYLGDLSAELEPAWTVARYTQRGTEPSCLDGDVTVEGHVRDVLAVLGHLGWERPILAGHSWGGHLALHVLGRHADRFAGAVIVDPLGGVGDGGEEEFQRTLLDRTPEPDRSRIEELTAKAAEHGALTPEEGDAMMRLSWPAYFAEPEAAPPMPPFIVSDRLSEMEESMFAALPALEARLRTCPLPVLFLHGSGSPMPVSASADTAAVMPDATLRVLDGVGHFHWMDRPGVVAHEVGEWWVSASARAPRG